MTRREWQTFSSCIFIFVWIIYFRLLAIQPIVVYGVLADLSFDLFMRTRALQKSPLRLIVLSHMYPRAYYPVGGIFVHEQVKALRRAGVDARIVSGEPFWVNTVNPRKIRRAVEAYRKYQVAWTEWENVPVLYFPYLVGYLFPPTLHALNYAYGFKRILGELCATFPFDLIHAHTSFLDGTAGVLARSVAARPLIITEHIGPFSTITRNTMMRHFTRRSIVNADAVLAVSRSLRHDMIAELGTDAERVTVVHNGFDPVIFNLGHDASQRPPTPHLHADRRTIQALWVGHFVGVKRVDRLLDSFANALKRIPELRLTLLGDGSEVDQAVAQIDRLGLRDHVTILGAADRLGVAAAMRCHDFLVISSVKETFGLVAVEALACGLPVLSTACGGPEEIVVKPPYGLIVPNDEHGLESGLVRMAEYVGQFNPMELNVYARSTFSWDAIAEQLLEIYRSNIGITCPPGERRYASSRAM